MITSTRDMNQWVKEKMKEGFSLLLITDKRYGYARAFLDREKNNVVVMNAGNEQQRVLREMEKRINI